MALQHKNWGKYGTRTELLASCDTGSITELSEIKMLNITQKVFNLIRKSKASVDWKSCIRYRHHKDQQHQIGNLIRGFCTVITTLEHHLESYTGNSTLSWG